MKSPRAERAKKQQQNSPLQRVFGLTDAPNSGAGADEPRGATYLINIQLPKR
jgi:hypothetical protein